MKHFENQTLGNRKKLLFKVVATVLRLLLTPIMVWYRLYLWVWDGEIFEKY